VYGRRLNEEDNMSYRWQRTIEITPGKFVEAIAWSKETVAFIEKKFGTPKIHIWYDNFGTQNTLRFSLDLPDLATFEKITSTMMADQQYMQAVNKAAQQQLFVANSSVQISREI
jgi:nitrogenase molybdenum-iron protein alpha/beta subunit